MEKCYAVTTQLARLVKEGWVRHYKWATSQSPSFGVFETQTSSTNKHKTLILWDFKTIMGVLYGDEAMSFKVNNTSYVMIDPNDVRMEEVPKTNPRSP